MGQTLQYFNRVQLRNDLEAGGFRVISEDDINDAVKFVVEGGIIVAYYESSGTAVFQGKNGRVAYDALFNTSTGAGGDRAVSNKILIIHSDQLECDARELAAQLCRGYIDPVVHSLKRVEETSLRRVIDEHRANLRYAVLLVRTAEIGMDSRVPEFNDGLVLALGVDHVAMLIKGKARTTADRRNQAMGMSFVFTRNAVPEVGRRLLFRMKVTSPSIARSIAVVERELAERQVDQPKVTKPKVTKPKVTRPKVTKPKVTKPKVTKPKVTRSSASVREVAQRPF